MSMNTPIGNITQTTPIKDFKELTEMELEQYLLGINNITQGDGAKISLQNLIKGITSTDDGNLIEIGEDGKLSVKSGALDLSNGWATAPTITVDWAARTVMGVGGVFYYEGIAVPALANFLVQDVPTDAGKHYLYYNTSTKQFEWSVGFPTAPAKDVYHIIEVVIFEDGNKFAINTWGFGGTSESVIEYLNATTGMVVLSGGQISNVVADTPQQRYPIINQAKVGLANFSQTLATTSTGLVYMQARATAENVLACEGGQAEIVPVNVATKAPMYNNNYTLTALESGKFMNVWLVGLPTAGTTPYITNYLYVTGDTQYDNLASAAAADPALDSSMLAIANQFERYCTMARFTLTYTGEDFSVIDYGKISQTADGGSSSGDGGGSSSGDGGGSSSGDGGGCSIPYGTEIALASTIDYVPVGFLPTNGKEYNASDFQEFWDDYLAYDVWSTQTVSDRGFNAIIYANNRFVAVGDSGRIAFLSTDYANWMISTQTEVTTDYNAIAYGNNKFVAVGHSGQISTLSASGSFESTQTFGVSGTVHYAITYGNNTFVAVGSGGQITTSTDGGINWTTQNTESDTSSNFYHAIAYGNNMFVAVGGGGQIATSSDGITWSVKIVGSNHYETITYVNNMFVAAGYSGQISTSTDGINWTTQEVGSENYNAIAYGNGKFVAVGNSYQIATSTDGINWTRHKVGSTGIIEHIFAITYANNMFVAVCSGGNIITSAGGINWTATNTKAAYGPYYRAIAYGNGKFVAVGTSGQTAMLTSTTYNRTTPPLSSLSYADYATEISNYEQCSKFGIDLVNNKFRVPAKFDKEYRYYIYAKDDDRTVEEWTDYVKSLDGNTTGLANNPYAPRIKKVYVSGTSGYIIWSNGYCEQWGYDTTASKTATVTLTKKYKDMNFNITDALGGPSSSGSYSNYANLYKPDSTSSFTIYKYDTNAARYCYWKTCGFLADGQY